MGKIEQRTEVREMEEKERTTGQENKPKEVTDAKV